MKKLFILVALASMVLSCEREDFKSEKDENQLSTNKVSNKPSDSLQASFTDVDPGTIVPPRR